MMHTCLSCFQCFRYNKIVIHENWHLMMPLFLDFCCLALFICRDSFCNWMRCSCIYFRDTNFLFEYNMPILFLIMDNCHDYTIFCGMFWVMFSVNVFFMYVVLVTLILDKCLWAWHEKRLKSCTKQTIRCSLSPYIRLDSSCQLATFGREFCTGHSRPPPLPWPTTSVASAGSLRPQTASVDGVPSKQGHEPEPCTCRRLVGTVGRSCGWTGMQGRSTDARFEELPVWFSVVSLSDRVGLATSTSGHLLGKLFASCQDSVRSISVTVI